MPEGPEVRVVADFLRLVLLNKHVYQIIDVKNIYTSTDILYVCDIQTKGKNIVLIMQRSDYNFVFFRCHLKMEGAWYKSDTCSSDKHLKIALQLADYFVCFSSSRFYTFERLSVDDLRSKLNLFGPDVLQTALFLTKNIESLYETNLFTLEYFLDLVTRKRLAKKTVGSLLLEQKYMSGIGNYMRAEILYLARISPKRQLQHLSREDVETLYSLILNYSYRCYLCQGHSIYTFKVPSEIRRQYSDTIPFNVYGRKEDNFGYEVVREKLGGRMIHWVPTIQL